MAKMQNSKSAGEFDDAAQTASATGEPTADELGTRGGGALRRMLAQGQPTPAALAELLKTLPQPAWAPILLEAQRDLQLGNSFVQQAVQLAQGGTGEAHALPFADVAAVQGAQAMGAQTFASGNQIELGKSSEHTAAHEAAHVVQQ
ncbi:MAG: hypothetical protein KBG15_11430 [Kofleriaceae bacterium]|nr:hypothetical protein [Kofleriaceae bacterium]